MEELLNKLYSYEYFGIYLTISIVVLIILFFVILFFGKKDKKEREIIATKKLQQINEDAFKDDSIATNLEVNNNLVEDENERNLNIVNEQTNEIPEIDEVPSIINNVEESNENEIPEPVLPNVEENTSVLNIEPIQDINVEESVIENNEELVSPVIEEISPILERVEEKPLVFNDLEVEEPVVPIIEQVKEEPIVEQSFEEEIEVPTFNFDEVVKSVEETKKVESYTKGPQIFSSVYVPEKKEEPVVEESKIEIPEVKEVSNISDDLDIELPTLKKDVVVEEKKEEPIIEEKEDKIELPVLNDYDLDNLSGETYTIK